MKNNKYMFDFLRDYVDTRIKCLIEKEGIKPSKDCVVYVEPCEDGKVYVDNTNLNQEEEQSTDKDNDDNKEEEVDSYGNGSLEPPDIHIPTPVQEADIVKGTINNYDPDAVYNISAEKGLITNVIDGEFDYTAPELDNGKDTTDTVSAYAVKNGNTSDVTKVTITIKALDITGDDAYIDDLKNDDSSYNDGFEVE